MQTSTHLMIKPKSVLIVSSSVQIYDNICDIFDEKEFSPVVYSDSFDSADDKISNENFDLLIVNENNESEFTVDFIMKYIDKPIGILLICKSDTYEKLYLDLEYQGVFVLQKPLNRNCFLSSVRIVSALHSKLNKFDEKNRLLREKIDDIYVIDRAKWLLIGSLNMSEKDAHYYIEKQAMNLRTSKRKIAENIIRTYDK